MSYRLLSVSADAKTIKGEKKGYLTGILYLAPASLSGFNVCANASPGCIAGCLNTAGRAQMFPMIIQGRIRKTKRLFADRTAFLVDLTHDIESLIRKAKREGLTPCVRLNGTSDLSWLAIAMASRFPEIQFYDYTKHPEPWDRQRPNYYLTFSASETNLADCYTALSRRVNVAMVFPVKRGRPLPRTWRGYTVLDGDVSDLRFLDARKGCIVGLRAKGKAKQDTTGFVQIQTS